MFAIDTLILATALLILVAIASSKFSSRFGVPVLVVFLALGMLAGSEGIGGIEFENYGLTHGIGTVALVLILFDGGLSTPMSSVRLALAPAAALATIGVVVTAGLTGAAAHFLLGLPLLEALLLGSIISSTDAAAVFSVLRGRGIHLDRRLTATLELESGSNDPMAVFLTVGLLEIMAGRLEPGLPMAGFFLQQMLLGGAFGLVVGRASATLNDRINLDAAGLYPILMTATALLAYGAAAATGGSGFLAVYIAGITLGNRRTVFQRGTLLFHDGVAWLAQIVMFILMGLLSFPSRLIDAAPRGLAIALVLILVARPAAVFLSLLPFRFDARRMTLIAWGGLKGAVPIILAIYPLLYATPGASLLFDVVFFVVLVSALAQGWTLPRLARLLRLEQPAQPEPPITLEITSLRHVEGDIVEYTVRPNSRAAGRLIRDLALPDGAVVALIARENDLIPPRGTTRVLNGDHVFLVMRPRVRPLCDRVFGGDPGPGEPRLPIIEFPLRAECTAADLEEFYGVTIDAPRESTLADILAERLGGEGLAPGSRLQIGMIELVVRAVEQGRIEEVGLIVLGTDP